MMLTVLCIHPYLGEKFQISTFTPCKPPSTYLKPMSSSFRHIYDIVMFYHLGCALNSVYCSQVYPQPTLLQGKQQQTVQICVIMEMFHLRHTLVNFLCTVTSSIILFLKCSHQNTTKHSS